MPLPPVQQAQPAINFEALRAALATVDMQQLTAPAAWRRVEFISDLHLQAQLPNTWNAWQQYLRTSSADAIFILGDLFEAWVGDDALSEAGSFEAQCAQMLLRASQQRPVYFMHGNRDFLIGPEFARATGTTLLHDPCCLQFAGQRYVLTHGDALCVEDTEYQQFRATARSPQWQAHVLAQPLAQRRQLAGQMRNQSEARKAREVIYADVDDAAATTWLHNAEAATLIHGHTHRPADLALGDNRQRIVLSDWDTDMDPPRAEVLRLDGDGLQRIALANYLAAPPSAAAG